MKDSDMKQAVKKPSGVSRGEMKASDMRCGERQNGEIVCVLPDDGAVGGRLVIASRLSDRVKGLLFSGPSDAILMLAPCHDIHTFGMRVAIDIAFLDKTGCVVGAERDVLPRQRCRNPKAVAVLERYAVPKKPWFEQGQVVQLTALERIDFT